MVVTACRCPEGFGLPHSHVPVPPEGQQTHGHGCRYNGMAFNRAPAPTLYDCSCPFTTEVRPWVNWKQVARELSRL